MIKWRKAFFLVARLGTRFLTATKGMPKELLPIIDKLLIKYAVEEAFAAWIDTLIYITILNKRTMEDNLDSNIDLLTAVRLRGKMLKLT